MLMNNDNFPNLITFTPEEFEGLYKKTSPSAKDIGLIIITMSEIIDVEIQDGNNNDEVKVRFRYDSICNTVERVFKRGFDIHDKIIDMSHRYIDEEDFRKILELITDDCEYQLHGNFSFFNCDFILQNRKLDSCRFENAIFKKCVNFSGCTFKGIVNFNYSRFLEKSCITCKFLEDVEFTGTDFLKKADFSYSHYSKADFTRCKFHEDVDFSSSIFAGEVNLYSAEFLNNANFSRSEFLKNVNLHGSMFFKDVDFSTSKFSGEFDSSGVVFFQDINFVHCEFLDHINIDRVGVEKTLPTGNIRTANFNNVKFYKVCHIKINCEGANFNESLFAGHTELSIFQGDATFDKCTFENTIVFNEFNKLSLNDIKLTGILYLDWNKLNAKQRKRDLILKKERTECKLIAPNSTTFQTLKENYRQLGQYDEEDEAYVEYKREKKKEKNGLFAKLPSLLDILGEYGTNPKLVACWMLIVPVIFGLIYTAIMEWGSGITIGTNMGNLLDGFYLSGITFLTIGFSDMYPTEAIPRLLVVIEGFMGLFLMAYLTISFTRKTLR